MSVLTSMSGHNDGDGEKTSKAVTHSLFDMLSRNDNALRRHDPPSQRHSEDRSEAKVLLDTLAKERQRRFYFSD